MRTRRIFDTLQFFVLFLVIAILLCLVFADNLSTEHTVHRLDQESKDAAIERFWTKTAIRNIAYDVEELK